VAIGPWRSAVGEESHESTVEESVVDSSHCNLFKKKRIGTLHTDGQILDVWIGNPKTSLHLSNSSADFSSAYG
jgi:hypothetical protein